MTRPHPKPPLFPYTPLFRSSSPSSRAPSIVRTTKRADGARHEDTAASTSSSVRARPIRSDASSGAQPDSNRSEEHTSELQSHVNLVCRLLLEKKKTLTEELR